MDRQPREWGTKTRSIFADTPSTKAVQEAVKHVYHGRVPPHMAGELVDHVEHGESTEPVQSITATELTLCLKRGEIQGALLCYRRRLRTRK